ncbi:uncharacterized protein PV09_03793 [Verruconis gallopava]|uniref:Uncharacterized protein n=1 Tax=Verruconis gallopava TaxID=253628 RepID=A0A0D1XRE1_9PEZI|nr:uncharacterized protein PV09_03793 [Verruconis gallopava]KIW05261.1 hypothetical protein PV09_03793 [Verruconis gallopava]
MTSLHDLPQDILFHILSQLICPLVSHDIARAPQSISELQDTEAYRLRSLTLGTFVSNHPYLCLAAQCRSLRFTVEDFCQHLLLKRMTLKSARILKPTWLDWSKGVAEAAAKGEYPTAKNLRSYRMQYLKWSVETCLFCGKSSKRRAIFNMHMWCCKKCDDVEFGKKISKTEATRKYRVNELHWKYPHILLPESWSAGLEFAFANLPVFQGAKMFKEDDIARLSAELKAHPPTRDLMSSLRRDDRAREEFLSKYVYGTFKDCDAVRIMGKTFDRLLSGELKLPATELTWQRLRDDARRCEKIFRDCGASRSFVEGFKRYLRWWDHLIPPALKPFFRLVTTKEEHGHMKHQYFVRTTDFSNTSACLIDGLAWSSFLTVLDYTSLPVFVSMPALEADREADKDDDEEEEKEGIVDLTSD